MILYISFTNQNKINACCQKNICSTENIFKNKRFLKIFRKINLRLCTYKYNLKLKDKRLSIEI